jgi:protein-disulfide isomerase
MTTSRRLVLSLVVSAVACSSAEKTEAPPPAPAPVAEPVAELSNQETIALEGRPGSTPPLEDATEPAPPPVAGVDGTPGPSPAFGPPTAPVRVYVLTDFQCPVCRRIVEPLKYLARRHPADVRLVVKHNALPLHQNAVGLATASIAAFRQGKFWAYHDRLFANPGPADETTLVGHAQALGLDVERFRKDLADPAVAAQVQYESGLAVKLGMESTPGFVVNGDTQMGWGSYMGIESQVDRALGRAKQAIGAGAAPERAAYEATRQLGAKGEAFAAALFVPPK